MDNIAPVRALNRRSTQLLQLGFIVLAVGVLMTVLGLVFTTILLLPRTHPLFWVYDIITSFLLYGGIVVVILAIAMGIRALTRRKENDLALLTGEYLTQTGTFDNRYSFIRNINKPGIGYIDAVLLGPPGVLVFRILDSQGNFANEAGNWLRLNPKDNEWLPWKINPTQETVEDVKRLREFMARKNLADVPVFGIIVFTAGPGAAQIAEKNPVVQISHLHTLGQNLGKQYLAKPDRVPVEWAAAVRRLLLE